MQRPWGNIIHDLKHVAPRKSPTDIARLKLGTTARRGTTVPVAARGNGPFCRGEPGIADSDVLFACVHPELAFPAVDQSFAVRPLSVQFGPSNRAEYLKEERVTNGTRKHVDCTAETSASRPIFSVKLPTKLVAEPFLVESRAQSFDRDIDGRTGSGPRCAKSRQ